MLSGEGVGRRGLRAGGIGVVRFVFTVGFGIDGCIGETGKVVNLEVGSAIGEGEVALYVVAGRARVFALQVVEGSGILLTSSCEGVGA